MNKTYDGVITKPELNEDTLAHYGIAKKFHKYIKKYIGKNGKWVYVYKRGAKNDVSRIKDFLNGFKPTTEAYITDSTGERRKATSENTPFTVKKKSLITTNATSTNASTGEKRKVDYSFKKSSKALAEGHKAQKEYEEYKKKYKKK